MKILIVSSFFPPQNSIASLRPYSWAKYWSKMGHDVTVLTAPKAIQASDSTADCSGFRVHYIKAPLLAPVSIQSNERPIVVTSKGAKAPLMRRCARAIQKFFSDRYGIFYSCRFPDLMDLWALKAKRWAETQHWDLVVSTGGPYSVHRVGLHIKHLHPDTKWIVDWRDLWSQNHFFPGFWLFRAYERTLERRFHRHADLVTTVSKPLAEALKNVGAKNVGTVFNGFDPDDYATLPEECAFNSDGIFRILYSGTIYAEKQNPTLLFKAIAALDAEGSINPLKLRVVFAGPFSDICNLAKHYGVADYVEYAGFLPRRLALRMQRDTDMLLFLGLKNHDNKGILTGKLFEYLYVNKPIIALDVGKDSEIGAMLEQVGSNIIETKEQLMQVLSTAIVKQQSWRGYSSEITEFSRHVQAVKMLDMLANAKETENGSL